MGGADAVAVRDRRQTLHRGAKKAPERFCFCLTQLRVFRRDVRDRAVMLAKLLAGGDASFAAARSNSGGGRRVAVGGQGLRQRPDLTASRCGVDNRPVLVLKLGHLAAGELDDRLGPGPLGQEPERARGQVVIGVLESAAASVGDREHPGWPAPAAIAVHSRRPAFDQAAVEQLIEVTPDGRGSQPERAAKSGRAHRARLQDQPGHAGARALLSAALFSAHASRTHTGSTHVFHNTSVP